MPVPTIERASDQPLESRCRAIELLVTDIDGVMTDGVIAINDQGIETKRFHVRDGTAVVLWHRAGKRSAIISGRSAESVEHRAAELKIGRVYQGIARKARTFQGLLDEYGLAPEQACFVGDDLADIPVLATPNLGLAACPADAVPEVLERAHLVTRGAGGQGVIREVVEAILKAQGLWDRLVDGYLLSPD
jgi:3-deoxy-D-manno-octulosonate 8-phosphate phosphatase (KDO 8-P phosphatase)